MKKLLAIIILSLCFITPSQADEIFAVCSNDYRWVSISKTDKIPGKKMKESIRSSINCAYVDRIKARQLWAWLNMQKGRVSYSEWMGAKARKGGVVIEFNIDEIGYKQIIYKNVFSKKKYKVETEINISDNEAKNTAKKKCEISSNKPEGCFLYTFAIEERAGYYCGPCKGYETHINEAYHLKKVIDPIDEITLNKLSKAVKDFKEKKITVLEFERIKGDILKTL